MVRIRPRPLDDAHRLPRRDQPRDQVAADEPRPAGDDRQVSHTPTLSTKKLGHHRVAGAESATPQAVALWGVADSAPATHASQSVLRLAHATDLPESLSIKELGDRAAEAGQLR